MVDRNAEPLGNEIERPARQHCDDVQRVQPRESALQEFAKVEAPADDGFPVHVRRTKPLRRKKKSTAKCPDASAGNQATKNLVMAPFSSGRLNPALLGSPRLK